MPIPQNQPQRPNQQTAAFTITLSMTTPKTDKRSSVLHPQNYCSVTEHRDYSGAATGAKVSFWQSIEQGNQRTA